MITLENEFYYEMENFTLVAQGELSGEFKVIEQDSFGFMIVLDLEDGMSYIIKK
tara:strand:- start:18 stop:179 length:162 start_codon:yes stop_codon:yes gene_type:complete